MPRRPNLDPLSDLTLPAGVGEGVASDAINLANQRRRQIREEGQGEGSSVAVLRVRRPGNTRGPLPGQGANQGTGVPDVADRTMQGAAHGGITGRSATPKPEPQTRSFTTQHGDPAPQRSTKAPGNARPVSVANASGETDTAGSSGIEDTEIYQSLSETFPLVDSVLQDIAGGTFSDSRASGVVDPNTLLPTASFQMPVFEGQEVFFGQDEFGNQGYGVIDAEGFFVLAPGGVQNEAAAKSQAIAAARQFFIGTDEATRDANLGLLREQVSSFLAGQREQVGRDFEADQAERDRAFQEYLTGLQNDFSLKRDDLNNAFTAHQNNIDRALQVARDDRDFALRQADFELASRRFQQETQLANAQFALGLFQSFAQNPELLYSLQSSGLLEQFQQVLPGLNIAGLLPPLAEEGGALANADLPELRDLQQMPADVQNQVLVTLSIQTGVRRETILAEIQRRASGQGLAGDSNNLQRIPA